MNRRSIRVPGRILLACALMLSCSKDRRAPASDAHALLSRAEEAEQRGEYGRAQGDFSQAAALFERTSQWEGCVRSYNGVGAAAARRGSYDEALAHLEVALKAAREHLGEAHTEVARCYHEMGRVFVSTGRYAEAEDRFGKALEIRLAAGGEREPELAEIYSDMGWSRTQQGQDDEALALYDKAHSIQLASLRSGDPRLALTEIRRGAAYWGKGDYDRAIDLFEKALSLLEAPASPRQKELAGTAYSSLANVYWSKGDYDQALEFHEKALPLLVTVLGERHPRLGTVHFNLATVHLMKGDPDAAIASVRKALAVLVPAFGERHDLVAQCYNTLGAALTAKGEPDQALGVLEKALAIELAVAGKGSRDAVLIYSTLGDAHRARGDSAQALAHYRKALELDLSLLGKRHPDVAEDYLRLGDFYLARGDAARALGFYDRAVVTNDARLEGRDAYLHPSPETAFSSEFLLESLAGSARALARRGRFEEALSVSEAASRLIDRMRAGYRAEGSKLFHAGKVMEVYDEAISTALRLDRKTDAFHFAEKSKAGVLLDALKEVEARRFARIPEDLLEKERRLRVDLASCDRQLIEAQLEPGATEAGLTPLRGKLFDLKREYEALLLRLEKEHSDYYDLKYRLATASADDVQRRLLDEGTALVEYFVGHERIFIFVITTRGLSVSSVAREASFEEDLRGFRSTIQERDYQGYARSARRLYETLIAPVEDALGGRDLIVVPDGLLTTIPFEALLVRDGGPPLIEGRAVRYAYSASVLLEGQRRKRSAPDRDFVAFAPVEAGAVGLGPLPASRKEVTDVLALFRQRYGPLDRWLSGRARVYLDREATESRVKAAGLERYRYVHFATHGRVDERHPKLSGLVLRGETGSAEDGVLHLGEVYNLRLNADLVVLSACETGLGQLARGEGIIGLARGFLYAGAQSLLVSLWPVGDAAASELIADFYRGVLAGEPQTRALREAKLRTIRRHPEYAKPYYWSAFVLIGG